MDLYNVYTESALVKAERDKLPDSSFGLPKSRQYPLHDAEHVRKAIQMFGHCPEGNRKELAENIYKAAKKFSVVISEKSLVFKYLSEKQQKDISSSSKKQEKMNESLPFLNLVDFYQLPLNEENINKYSPYYSKLNMVQECKDRKGLLLVDRNDQVAGFIQVDTKTGYLHKLDVNPVYKGHDLDSKLLNTEIGKSSRFVRLDSDKNNTMELFLKNGFYKKYNNELGNTILVKKTSNISEDSGFMLSGNTLKMSNVLDEKIDETIEALESNNDIVANLESYLNSLREASVAGVACVAPLVGQTIRKPFTNDTARLATSDCPNLFDYDEFYEPEESIFVCSEDIHTNTFDRTSQVDVAKNTADRDSNSTSEIRRPQAMMVKNEDNGVVGAIIWDIIKFIFSLPFRLGKFIAKQIKNSDAHKIKKAMKAYMKFYDGCLDLSKIANNHKEISLQELCKVLGVSTREINKVKTESIVKVTAWYKGKTLVSYFIEILETKNSTEYEYVLGIVDKEYAKDPTKTLLCAVMEYTTNSYGKYLDRLNTILRKRGEKLLEDVALVEDIDATAASDSKFVDYKDQSTDVIVGIDRYTNHKDENGCYYIALNANEQEDQVQKNLILPYINDDMFITADLHLNHKNRNSANFANILVSEINAKVPIDGLLMILGDLGSKGDANQKEYLASFIRRLNVSKKILILGNHDNLSLKDYYDMGFTFVSDRLENEDYIFSHCPEDPKDKINIHGHIHNDKEYWNIPAEGHINAYIGGHDNKVYTLKEYLKFYKQGKYKGKSVKKKFD